MKILLPSLMKCRRIYKLLKIFYESEKKNYYIDNKTSFNHALILFCAFYNISVPHVKFRRSFGHEKCVGMCMGNGNIQLLYPYNYRNSKRRGNGNVQSWIGIVYHELGHYYLWAKAEEKAMEFELKMMKRR